MSVNLEDLDIDFVILSKRILVSVENFILVHS